MRNFTSNFVENFQIQNKTLTNLLLILSLLFAIALFYLVPVILGLGFEDINFTGMIRYNRLVDYSGFLEPVKIWLGKFWREYKTLPLWLNSQGMGVPLIEQNDFGIFNPLEWP